MFQSFQKFYDYENQWNEQEKYHKESTQLIVQDIFDEFQGFIKIEDYKGLDQESNSKSNWLCQRTNHNKIIKSINIKKQKNQITFMYNYKTKEISFSNNFFLCYLHKLIEKKTLGEFVFFIHDWCWIFYFNIFIEKNCRLESLKNFIEKKEKQLNELIFLIEKIMCNARVQSNISFNLCESNIKSKNHIQLIKQIFLLDENQQTNTVELQMMCDNNLYRKVYKNQFQTDRATIQLIQNGDLKKLEMQINSYISSFDCKIQEIYNNLFLEFLIDFQKNKNYQFQEQQKFSEYLDNFQHNYDTFQVRLQLLIQIMCSFLLSIKMNLINLMEEKEVVLINSNKQIQLDMLEYLKKSQSNFQKTEQKSRNILNYFELLLPKREKTILINGYNLSAELQNLKDLIRKNEINLNNSILRLLKVQLLVIRHENEGKEFMKQSMI
ncbi:unnamed protein product [Paramecium sonneborni]|uniref:Uncharacterized protein n=1 Tax=Paramecium sonneborni TaxID=65129 RepID=A0A8S1M2J9_9CILI|nr:unnamed protein product [Paramecium sonneborni]